MPVKSRFLIFGLLGYLVFASSICGPAEAASCTDSINFPAEVQVGDRLFRETRFAAFFFFNDGGNVNAKRPIHGAEPEIAHEQNASGKPLPDPFRGLSMNCRNCHLGDDLLGVSSAYGRTYCDFARRSPILDRADGHLTSPRNSQELVSVTLPREVPSVFHFDGEFASIEDLTIATLTGRNMGWLPTESAQATAHIANVIRNDNGHNALAARYGCGGFPYKVVLLGTDPRLPKHLQLPSQYRIDVTKATDDQILAKVGLLIHAYMDAIVFDPGEPPSPYDIFLQKNNLPTAPNSGESNAAYAQRLSGLIQQLSNPVFVTPKDGTLKLHKPQKFQFGPNELQGLKTFFAQNGRASPAHTGNCVACHVPPNFTDNMFHNTGVAQTEYDGVFGAGSFAALSIPSLSTRNSNFDAYLPPSANHPNATGVFRSPASQNKPGFTDLGVWNIFANPDIPNPQNALTTILCGEFKLGSSSCTPDAVLPMAISFFKTPSIKDQGQSSPYFHNGSLDTIDQVVNFYTTVSQMARGGHLPNPSPELSNIFIDQTDIATLSAFLNSLNEDYH